MKRLLTIIILATITLVSCTNKGGSSLKLIPVKSGEKWGYIDKEGKYVINPQFDEAHVFFDGLALVKANDGKYGFIGENGKYKINPIYKKAQTHFSKEGLVCVVQENELPKFINKDGKVKFTVDNAEIVKELFDGLAAVKIKNKWGFIDASGTLKINPEYDAVSTFGDGLSGVAKKDKKSKELKWGFINKEGKLVINYQFSTNSGNDVLAEFSSVSGLSFQDGLAAVSNDGEKWGYINKEGNYEINPQFDKAFSFSNDYALVKQGEQYGYINKQGKFVINPQFINAFSFSSDKIAPVQNTDGKWGFIDIEGKYVINPQFDEVFGNYFEGIAIVKSSDKFGIINKKGAYQVNPQFDELFIQDLFIFQGVSSDFLDAQYMTNQILEKTNDTSFRNISANTTLNDIIKLHPDQTEDDLELNTLIISEPKIYFADNTAITQIQYFFYNNTFSFNADYEKEINLNAKTLAISYSFGLLKTGKGKSKKIIDELKNQLIKRYNMQLREHPNIMNNTEKGIYILKGKFMYVQLNYYSIEVDDEFIPVAYITIVFNNYGVEIDDYEKNWIEAWIEKDV